MEDILSRKRGDAGRPDQSRADEAVDKDHHLRVAQRLANVGSWEWDAIRDSHWWSDELYSLLSFDRHVEPSFKAFLSRVHPDDRDRIEFERGSPIDGTQRQPQELRLLIDGRETPVELCVETRRDSSGRAERVIGTVRDVTEARELSARLEESERRYASTVDIAAVGITHVSPSGRFVWANRHLTSMLGYGLEELQALSPKDISHPEDRNTTAHQVERLRTREIHSFKAEKRYVRKDGDVIWVRITCASRFDRAGQLMYDVSVVEDISEQKAAEARINYLATHDELTGLANRALFMQLLEHGLASASRYERQLGVLFVDLDRFKLVNDTLGHRAGDTLVRTIAERFRGCMRKSDVVARLGGDEFVVLAQAIDSVDDVTAIAKRLLSAAIQPVRISGNEFRVTASIGIALYPEDGEDSQTIMKHADMAMYAAKELGKNNYQHYSPDAAPVAVARLSIQNKLAGALERGELTLHYQPKVDLGSGQVSGAEALLRWWNHELGAVSPTQFISVAEDTGLIVPIGRWVLRQACEQAVAWQREGHRPIVMSVNLSARQFQDESLVEYVSATLRETGLDPKLLELEMTESMLMRDVDEAVAKISRIKALGVRIAVDDFGTGYSSLSQLKRFPFDTLKVDRSFVRDIPENKEDLAITEAIISLAKKLGVEVVAEGVERAVQNEVLKARGCDAVQGFYFSAPCNPKAFVEMIRQPAE